MMALMTPAQQLVDECRALEARLYGKRIELYMLLGQRADAQHWLREMNAVVQARQAATLMHAEEQGEDYFSACGARDAALVRQEAKST